MRNTASKKKPPPLERDDGSGPDQKMSQIKQSAKLKQKFVPKPHEHKFKKDGAYIMRCRCGAILFLKPKI